MGCLFNLDQLYLMVSLPQLYGVHRCSDATVCGTDDINMLKAVQFISLVQIR